MTGLGLGAYALAARPDLPRRIRVGPREVILGLAAAGALYGTFALGDRFARRFVPSGERDIADIYELRGLRPRPPRSRPRLATVIGPAEEVFWRGFVQDALMARLGRWPGRRRGGHGLRRRPPGDRQLHPVRGCHGGRAPNGARSTRRACRSAPCW